jgi:hypothetical protein
MNLNKIITILQDADPEFHERTSPRRHILKSFSSKVTALALPFALGAFLKKAYGQGSTAKQYIEALVFALQLEYLEDSFYTKVLADPTIFPNDTAKAAFMKLGDDEAAHVKFLQMVIDSTGTTVMDRPGFDFTGGKGNNNGMYKSAFSDYLLLLELTQAIEDLGTAAYKAQIIPSMPNNTFLTNMLSIHSIEARHAARVRMLRMEAGVQNIKPWVMNNSTELIDPSLAKQYTHENSTIQNGIEITGLNGEKISAEAARSAFDEPLRKDEVLKLIDPFLIP